MKYLKSYENINIPLKKYVIWKQDTDLEVFEVTDKIEKWDTDKVIIINILYKFKLGKIEPVSLNKRPTAGLDLTNLQNNIKNFCIYQSDNLQDCLDILEILDTSNKYNL
jgi:hypothetical protein